MLIDPPRSTDEMDHMLEKITYVTLDEFAGSIDGREALGSSLCQSLRNRHLGTGNTLSTDIAKRHGLDRFITVLAMQPEEQRLLPMRRGANH